MSPFAFSILRAGFWQHRVLNSGDRLLDMGLARFSGVAVCLAIACSCIAQTSSPAADSDR